jgi:hypothetical protein
MEMRRTVLLMMLAAIGAAVAVALVDSRHYEAAAAEQNQLLLLCSIYRVATVDPIQPQADHLHAFAGNRSVSDNSTYESLVSNPNTSCERPFVTSAYWTMATYWGGEQVDPIRVAVYYHAAHPERVSHIPDGLQMLASDANGEVTFKCGRDPTPGLQDPPYNCTQNFRIIYSFPECWDQRSLLHTSLRDRRGNWCDAGYREIISVRLAFHYKHPHPGEPLGSPLEVSTGADQRSPWTAAHADAFEANQQNEFNKTIRQCVMEQQALPICSPKR